MPPLQGIPENHREGIQECLQSQSPNYPHSVSTPGACAEARVVAKYLHETFPGIRTIVDVGTAGGHFPMAWLEQGGFAIGIDPHPDAPLTLGAPILLRDAGLPLDVLPRADAVTCWDCAEHIPANKADQFVRNLCLMAPMIFFSSDDKPGAQGHVHCVPPEYWELLFAKEGYYRATKMPGSELLWSAWRMGLKATIEASPPHESYLYWIWTDASYLYLKES
jgi:hypothetical protein